MKRVIFLFILALALAACGSQTAQRSPADQQATATVNAASTAAAIGETAITNDLTQQAMTPTARPPSPVPSPTPQTGIGGTQQSGPWSITINSVKPTVSDNQFEVPKAGNQFILINFTAQNTSGGAQDMNPFYFTLRDDSGTTYDLTALTVARDPSGTVLAAQKLRGDLSYELPKTLHSFTLQFDVPDDVDHSEVVQWNLTI